jgi:uncharacterized protein (DUF1800 family)
VSVVVAALGAWVGAQSAAGASLYVAALAPQGDAVSLGSGRAVLQVDDGEQRGTLRVQYSNLSGPLAGAHIHAPDGAIVFDLDTTPLGEDGTRAWTVSGTGAWPRDRLLASLRAGECYLNLHTGKYPSGEIKGFLRPTSGSTTFTPPPPPPALPGGQPNPRDAARFLVQATYGPTSSDIARVRQRGYAGWIEDQLKLPMRSHLAYVDALPGEDLPSEHARESIWQQAILGSDQLRQRVALALSEIFVVSDRDDDLSGVEGIAAYMDLLSRHAFGNYRGLLRDVALSPAMGAYLDMLGSAKEDPESGRKPNENFPREILQLFSIGLYELHPDGTLRLDGAGAPIPTYDQATVEGYARVFTGWTFADQDHSEDWRFEWPEPRWRRPMEAWPEHHERGPKTLLGGVVLPGGATPEAELDAALATIFRHPNVGPFVCRQLIQRLVTSNPSPAYVYRCGRAFADNGRGVRGDMKAVVKAILLDWEARDPGLITEPGYGRLREPMVRFVALLRALEAKPPADGRFRYYWIDSDEWGVGQAPLRAPSVFNFFSPTFARPGAITAAGLVSPEFQITTETSVFGNANFLHAVLFDGWDNEDRQIRLDYSWLTLARNDAELLDRVNTLFYGRRLPAETRAVFQRALADRDFPRDKAERVPTLIWLVALSPDFAVQK